MLHSIINQNWKHLTALLTVIAVLYACVFIAVIIDLFFGIKRAKKLKIARTSYGYRRTITKLTSYFGLMIMLTIADIAASVIFKIPYFTAIGALGIIIVEAKSVFENLRKEEKGIEEIQKTILKLLQNKEEIKELINLLKSKD